MTSRIVRAARFIEQPNSSMRGEHTYSPPTSGGQHRDEDFAGSLNDLIQHDGLSRADGERPVT